MHRAVQKAVENTLCIYLIESQMLKPGGQIFVAKGRCLYLFNFGGE